MISGRFYRPQQTEKNMRGSEIMLNPQENEMQKRKGAITFIPVNDILKQIVMLDAIRSNRRIKSRLARFF